jgi:hypothetical protein
VGAPGFVAGIATIIVGLEADDYDTGTLVGGGFVAVLTSVAFGLILGLWGDDAHVDVLPLVLTPPAAGASASARGTPLTIRF